MAVPTQCLIEQCAIADPASAWSLFLGWTSAAITGLVAVLVAWLLVWPSALSFMVAVGYGLSVVLNVLLKVIIQQDRPHPGGECGAGFGMPSGHVQHATYVFVTLLLVAVQRMARWIRVSGAGLTVWRTALVAVTGAALLVFVGISRVQLQYHTAAQVLVAYVVGAMWALTWALLWLQMQW